MQYQKIIKLAVSREVRIVVTGYKTGARKEVSVELDFFVKDLPERDFRPLIGLDHPQYWKFKKYPAAKSQYLQLEYSGVSRAQLNKVINEFQAQYDDDFTFIFRADIDKRIKYLKGLRVSARSIRSLAAE